MAENKVAVEKEAPAKEATKPAKVDDGKVQIVVRLLPGDKASLDLMKLMLAKQYGKKFTTSDAVELLLQKVFEGNAAPKAVADAMG